MAKIIEIPGMIFVNGMNDFKRMLIVYPDGKRGKFDSSKFPQGILKSYKDQSDYNKNKLSFDKKYDYIHFVKIEDCK